MDDCCRCSALRLLAKCGGGREYALRASWPAGRDVEWRYWVFWMITLLGKKTPKEVYVFTLSLRKAAATQRTRGIKQVAYPQPNRRDAAIATPPAPKQEDTGRGGRVRESIPIKARSLGS